MKTIKVMPDYHCWPLWNAGGEIGNIDPALLPISEDLRSALLEWADVFDAILVTENPAASEFASEEARAEFDRHGRELARQVAKELSGSHHVLYFSVVQRKVEAVSAA